MRFEDALREMPLIAILRGLRPEEAVAVGDVLFEAGFRVLEVPLNSPEPLRSIAALVRHFEGRMVVGAGTVLDTRAVADVAMTGAKLIVSPNFDAGVIKATKSSAMASAPGVGTVTEAFAALAAGADVVKLFPAEMMPPTVVKAMRAVLPRDAKLCPVGGITPDNMAGFRAAGADAFGIGSALFKPGMTPAEVAGSAARFVAAARG